MRQRVGIVEQVAHAALVVLDRAEAAPGPGAVGAVRGGDQQHAARGPSAAPPSAPRPGACVSWPSGLVSTEEVGAERGRRARVERQELVVGRAVQVAGGVGDERHGVGRRRARRRSPTRPATSRRDGCPPATRAAAPKRPSTPAATSSVRGARRSGSREPIGAPGPRRATSVPASSGWKTPSRLGSVHRKTSARGDAGIAPGQQAQGQAVAVPAVGAEERQRARRLPARVQAGRQRRPADAGGRAPRVGSARLEAQPGFEVQARPGRHRIRRVQREIGGAPVAIGRATKLHARAGRPSSVSPASTGSRLHGERWCARPAGPGAAECQVEPRRSGASCRPAAASVRARS